MDQQAVTKRWYLSTKLHGVSSDNTVTLPCRQKSSEAITGGLLPVTELQPTKIHVLVALAIYHYGPKGICLCNCHCLVNFPHQQHCISEGTTS